MSTLKASVLILGHPNPNQVQFGADFAKSIQEFSQFLKSHAYRVVVIPSRFFSPDLLSLLEQSAQSSQKILVHDQKLKAEELALIINQGRLFQILKNFDAQEFETQVQGALAEFDLAQQNNKLLELFNEQNENLKRMSQDLEERVEKRQKLLEESRQKLILTNQRQLTLHQCLVAVHRANSIGELETLLSEVLKKNLNLENVRIFFKNFTNLQDQPEKHFSVYKSTIQIEQDEIGSIYFLRTFGDFFTKEEISFLSKITKAVSLAVDRLTKMEKSESFKQEWDASFDAIMQPVSLVDDQMNLVRVNKSFAEQTKMHASEIIGQKCYQVLMKKNSPCRHCHLGKNFRLDPARTSAGDNVIYEVHSQEVPMLSQHNAQSKNVYVHMYNDVSIKLKFERQLVENAKIAELGIIGSSIAHELNNPLGGVLSFLQLIKMDLKGNESYYSDIVEMEQGVLRCKEIIQNLLVYTRRSEPDFIQELDLSEVLKKALKIIELQTRSQGLAIHLNIPKKVDSIQGKFNELVQSMQVILQNGLQGLKYHNDIDHSLRGQVDINLRQNESGIFIEMNFKKDQINQTEEALKSQVEKMQDLLGLGMAFDMIREHGGELEFLTPDKSLNVAKISFLKKSRLDVSHSESPQKD